MQLAMRVEETTIRTGMASQLQKSTELGAQSGIARAWGDQITRGAPEDSGGVGNLKSSKTHVTATLDHKHVT